jgi:hypothetical protein
MIENKVRSTDNHVVKILDGSTQLPDEYELLHVKKSLIVCSLQKSAFKINRQRLLIDKL